MRFEKCVRRVMGTVRPHNHLHKGSPTMHFCLSTVLITASSLVLWSTVFGETTLADVPKQSRPAAGSTPASQSNSQAVYVGFGCSASDNTAFSLYSSRELRYRDKTITIPIKWEEVSGQGFCGRTHYLTEEATTNRPLSGGVTASSNFASAVWVFTSPTATDVSIAAYIPADRYAEDLNRLKFPPVLVDRQVEYIVEIEPENSSSSTTRKCLSKMVD